jgi:hypothetical protein
MTTHVEREGGAHDCGFGKEREDLVCASGKSAAISPEVDVTLAFYRVFMFWLYRAHGQPISRS